MLRVEDFRAAQSNVHPEVGAFERFEKTGENIYTASGWAILPDRNEPADAILIMYERTGGPPHIFGRFPLNVNRDFISQLLHRSFYVSPQWRQSVTAPSRTGETTVSAWVLDAYSGKLYKLSGTHSLK